ncbi:MAG: CarD family transcriptional regulator [Lachnospiraceae bacterium]|nr:CarD family transcriptional regulator [Lachnospiraceae bacterium]
MFSIGEYVVYGSKGVCTVEDISTLNLPDVDSDREYYILKPLYIQSSTVYVPIDASDSLRKVLNKTQAKKLIKLIPDIPLIENIPDKLLEQEYKVSIRSNSCEEWVKIIKTIYRRKQKRIEAGRKITAVDAKYSRMAEDSLYGELAVALGMPKDEVEDYITSEIA